MLVTEVGVLKRLSKTSFHLHSTMCSDADVEIFSLWGEFYTNDAFSKQIKSIYQHIWLGENVLIGFLWFIHGDKMAFYFKWNKSAFVKGLGFKNLAADSSQGISDKTSDGCFVL